MAETKKIDEQQQDNKMKMIGDKINTSIDTFRETSKKKWFKMSVYLFLLIFTILCVVRIPYVGVFFDSVFFSFFFGFAKYLIYAYIIVLLVQLIIDKKVKILFSKRFVLAIFLSATFLSIMISGIELLNKLANKQQDAIAGMVNEYIKHWKDYMFSSAQHFVFVQPGYLDGGIIGALVGATSGFFLIIFSIIAILTIFLLLFKSWRVAFLQKVKTIKGKKLRDFRRKKRKDDEEEPGSYEGGYKQEQLNFIEAQKDSRTKKITVTMPISIDYLDSLLYSKKADQHQWSSTKTTLDKQVISKNLKMFFREYNLDTNDVEAKKTSETFNVIAHMLPEKLQYFRTIAHHLNDYFSDDDYCIEYLDQTVVIKFKLNQSLFSSKINKIIRTQINNPLDFVYGFGNGLAPILLNLKTNNLIGINSTEPTNIHNSVDTIVTSVAWNYNFKNIRATFLSTDDFNKNDILKNKLFENVVIGSSDDVLQALLKLETYCQDLAEMFKKNDVKSIYEYNNSISNVIPNKIIFINNIDQLVAKSKEVYHCIKRIAPLTYYCGVTIICLDHSQNFASYDNIHYQLVSLFKTNNEVSRKVIGSEKAVDLERLNYGILSSESEKKALPFIMAPYSDSEVKTINKIIKNTWDNFDL